MLSKYISLGTHRSIPYPTPTSDFPRKTLYQSEKLKPNIEVKTTGFATKATTKDVVKACSNASFSPSPASDVSDLSDIYVPNIGQLMGSFATYPPETTTDSVFNKAFASSQQADFPILTDSTTYIISADAFDKENQSPN